MTKGALVEAMEEERPKENFIVIAGAHYRLKFKKAKCPDIKTALQKHEKKCDPQSPVGKFAAEWIIKRLKFDKDAELDEWPDFTINGEYSFKLVMEDIVKELYKVVGFKEDKSQKKLEGD